MNVFVKSIFLFAGFALSCWTLPNADEMIVPSEEELLCQIPRDWTEIEDLDQRKVPIQLALAALKSNFEMISTYAAKYTIESDMRQDKSLLNSNGNYQIVFDRDPLWHRKFVTTVISDKNRNKTYRSVEVAEDYLVYEGNKIERDPEFFLNTVSIDTSDEYVYLKSGKLYQGIDTELPGHPNVPIDSVAWIEQPGYNDNKSHDVNVEPYRYYDPSQWASFDYVLDVMDGKYGGDERKKLNETVRIYEAADDSGAKWFRYRHFFDDRSEVNVLMNDTSDFLPIYTAHTSESGLITHFLQVKWGKFNGVFVPVETSTLFKSSQGELRTRPRMSITDIRINEPLDQDQFTYGALGLQGESLIMNQIQKKVYRLKDGKLEFVANYNTKYENTREKLKFSRTRILLVVCGFTLVIAGGVLLRRQR